MKRNLFSTLVLSSALCCGSMLQAEEARWINSSPESKGVWTDGNAVSGNFSKFKLGQWRSSFFSNGDDAKFIGGGVWSDAEGLPISSETIKVSGAVAPSSIAVNVGADSTYVITYKDAIATDILNVGVGTIVKEGAGTLNMNVHNTMTGTTTIKGGRLNHIAPAYPAALGSKVILDGGVLGISSEASADRSVSGNAANKTTIEAISGKLSEVYLGRYSVWQGELIGSDNVKFYTGGERCAIGNRSGVFKMQFSNWTGREFIVAPNPSSPEGVALNGLLISPEKMVDISIIDTMKTIASFVGIPIDSTFVNKKIKLTGNSGLTFGSTSSGGAIFAIGEIESDGEGWLGGYGWGQSNSPKGWYMVGCLGSDVTTPLALKATGDYGSNPRFYNNFGIIKVGKGTYTFTNTNNINTMKENNFKGLHIMEGAAYFNIPLTDKTTAFGRNISTGNSGTRESMLIYPNGVGGGNGRLTGYIVVKGGKLEVGYKGIGTIALADTLMADGVTQGSFTSNRLDIANGVAEFEIQSVNSFDKVNIIGDCRLRGNRSRMVGDVEKTYLSDSVKIVVKVRDTHTINDGDRFEILTTTKNKTDGDSCVYEFQNVPQGVTLSVVEEPILNGVDAENNPIYEGFRIVVVANGSSTGITDNEADYSDVRVLVEGANLVVEADMIQSIDIFGQDGRLENQFLKVNASSVSLPLTMKRGIYFVSVKTDKGAVVKKIVL